MKKKIILVGKGGSGKDYFSEFLRLKGYTTAISHTSRPMREGETYGVEYYFISKLEFETMLGHGEFREHTFFNDNYYGNTNEIYNAADSIILTPSGVQELSEKELENSVVVYFDIDPLIREKRMEERIGAGDLQKRLDADNLDFMDFSEYNLRITDPEFYCPNVLDIIKLLRMS